MKSGAGGLVDSGESGKPLDMNVTEEDSGGLRDTQVSDSKFYTTLSFSVFFVY